jgi:hypothetical protein
MNIGLDPRDAQDSVADGALAAEPPRRLPRTSIDKFTQFKPGRKSGQPETSFVLRV